MAAAEPTPPGHATGSGGEGTGDTLLSCLAAFTAPETLTAENRYVCDDGSSRDAVKRLLLRGTHLPPILTLHLKRFAQVGVKLKKYSGAVPFPLTLDMAPYCLHPPHTLNEAHTVSKQRSPLSTDKHCPAQLTNTALLN
eukprot:COSAG01_NODE_1216_length_11192_cov_10.328678_8_plen_139_part_00